MRILYHHRTRGRGVEGVHICGVARALEELGHQVDILSFPGAHPNCGGRDAEMREVTRKPNVLHALFHWLTARIPEPIFELLELAYNAVALLRIDAYCRRHRPGLIYERYALFMFAGVWLARRRGVPIVIEVNDSALVERVRPLFFKRLAGRIERWVFRRCGGLVFISGRFRQEAVKGHGEIARAIVSPNAVDARLFTPSEEQRAVARRELGVEGRVVCGYVGAFLPWHGIDGFVREIAPRLRARPELVLLLVGDGKLYAEIQRFVEEQGLVAQVLLPGRVPHSQVPRLIAAMDFAVLPNSNTYGSPMKVFELMGMGVAVVAPDFDPLREAIRDGETGWLFPARDRRAGVERVLAVCTDRPGQRRVGAASRAYVLRERQWTNNARQLLDLHGALVGGQGRPSSELDQETV